MKLDPCSIVTQIESETVEHCHAFSDGIIMQGLGLAFQMYFDDYRQLLIDFDQLRISSNYNPDVYWPLSRQMLKSTRFN